MRPLRSLPALPSISTVAVLSLASACSVAEPPSAGGETGAGATPAPEACAAGQIISPTGACMPVGIQGCAGVFLEEDGLCHPRIDKCPPGTIPKLDEGCIEVGIPRSKCADIFLGDDGICRPTMEACAGQPGTFAVPSEGCVPIDGPDGCGAGTWGNLPDEPGAIHVDAAAAPGGDGSRLAPVQTIGEAIALVDAGGRIAIAAGTYEEGLDIAKSVELAGRCPSMVHLTGVTNTLDHPATVLIEDNEVVRLRGLSIGRADTIGIWAVFGAEVAAEWVHVRGAGIAGIVASSRYASIALRHVFVEATDGFGLQITAGALGVVESSAFVGSVREGMTALGPGAELTIGSSLVTGTKGSSEGGAGVLAQRGKVTLRESAVVRNETTGLVAVDEGGELVATNNTVSDNTRAQPADDVFFNQGGVLVLARTRISLAGNAILANEYFGVLAKGAGATLESADDLIALTRSSAEGEGGPGLMVEDGATASLVGAALVRNRAVGANVIGGGSALSLDRSLVEGTLPEALPNTFGYGLQVRRGAHVVVVQSAVVGNGTAGILLSDGARGMEISTSIIEATAPEASHRIFGRGIAAQRSDALVLDASVITDNRDVGIVLGEMGDASITRTLVQNTLPQESDGTYGAGIFALSTTVRILDATVRASHTMGIGMQDCTADLRGVVIDDVATALLPVGTGTNRISIGDGILCMAGSSRMADAKIQGASRAGLLFDGCGGEVVRTSSVSNRIGVVLQGTPRPELGEGNLFDPNAEAKVVTDGDMPVPAAPSPIP